MLRSSIGLLLILALVGPASPGTGQEKYADPPITAKDREHWAFVAPKRHEPPKVERGETIRNPIDAFIRARLTKAGLKPSPEADRLTLIRRVTLDLTGLPPSSGDIEAFLIDREPGAYERVVDRLLASPHFGERWAQHWLDVVRFAESNGYELDAERPHAWRYRDYVIKSFNADKPYDRFLAEQIAGDELAAGLDPRSNEELLIATGLHRCGPVHVVSGNLDQEELRQERLTEMVNGVGAVFLGLTMGCARCHDHKFDPISAGDYYRMQAYFASSQYADVDIATAADRERRKKEADALTAKIAPIKKEIGALDAPYRARIGKEKRASLETKYRDALAVPAGKRTATEKKLAADAEILIKVSWDEVIVALSPADREKRAVLREQLHALEARMPAPAAAAWAIGNAKSVETHVLRRGDVKRKLLSVGPAAPRVVEAAGKSIKTRMELARWLTSPDHPLTARVAVNRLWHYHFGRGLVATPNDFGTRGERPTHPELLDWLALELIDKRWSLKSIHRLIATSATYRQSAATGPGATIDPDNALLWRMNRRRLEAEAIRDSILAAAGTLNPKLGGESIKIPLEPEVYDLIFTEGEPDGLWPVTPDVREHTRRSVYLFNKRNVRLPMFEAFDQPDTVNSCAHRPVSTFAPQALILMNAPFVRQQGLVMAIDLVASGGNKETDPIDRLYQRTFGRKPGAEESRLARQFLNEQTESLRDRMRARQPIGIGANALPAGADPARVRALADLCVVIVNTHEFVYIP